MKTKFGRDMAKFAKISGTQVKNDILAGITVALALVPESVAFAFVAGVSPILSLQTAVIIGFIAATFTGRPGMISSSTAAISVVIASLVADHGLEYLFATVVLMGIIQVLMGVFKLGKYTRIIPHAVMLGFLNGLSIVLFIAQLAQFKVDGTVIVDGIETIGKVWMPTADLGIMIGFVLFTMAVIHFFPKLTKAVPSSLVAILIMTLISVGLSHFGIYDLRTVEDFAGMKLEGSLPGFHIPDVPFNLEMLKIIFPYALIGGLVGLTEASLTLRVIDEMTDTKGRTNREFFAQGLANVVNGFFGGMGGDAMIGQSIINIKSGGRMRLSGLVAASTLLLFILVGSGFVNAIPLAGLVGVMFMVVVGTFKWESLKYGGKIPKNDIIIVVLVTVLTVVVNLATAVIAGVVLSALMFAWEKGKVLYADVEVNDEGTKIYHVNGSLFFGSVANFKELFDVNGDPQKVFLDLKYAKVLDYSAIEGINAIADRYKETGKEFSLKRVNHNCMLLFKNADTITDIEFEKAVEESDKYPSVTIS